MDQTLCAAAHLVEGFADYTFRIMNGRPQAGAPSLTEDPVALLRHAGAARRLRRFRDALCCLIAFSVGGLILVRLTAELGLLRASLVLALTIAGWAGRRQVKRALRAWFTWAWRNGRDRHRKGPLRWLAATALLAALAAGLVLAQPVLWTCVAVALTGLALGWFVVVGESAWAHRRAAAVLAAGAPPARQLAARLNGELERRVGQLATANVVAYSESRAAAPFVGNGFIVRPWKTDIDVTKRAAGTEDSFELFDIVDFHEWLEAQFAIENAVESSAARQLTAGHRLYVDGRKIAWESDLVAAEQPLPRSRVDWEYLARELRQSDRAEDRRVYFYVQEVCRGGDIAVCILVRPLLQGGTLSIEFVPLVIPPIQPDVRALIDTVPIRLRDQCGRAIRIWTRHTPAAVFGSPLRCAASVAEWLHRLTQRSRWRLAARYGWFYDLGAVMSVREGVCWADPDELDHFVIRDLIRINDRLRDRLMTSIKAYLREHGIDVEQLATGLAITNIQNWNVGNVRADMVGFGNSNTFGDKGQA
ncbi:hypothetical protein [Actinoplanes sp. NPDC049599]|uniref:hypothetical protein n=1 Tax=Actinoplanes sp. NPDC049599 TaxID=3363903 RepID=UPI0037BA65DD